MCKISGQPATFLGSLENFETVLKFSGSRFPDDMKDFGQVGGFLENFERFPDSLSSIKLERKAAQTKFSGEMDIKF